MRISVRDGAEVKGGFRVCWQGGGRRGGRRRGQLTMIGLALWVVAGVSGGIARAQTPSFIALESGSVRPLALSPDGTRLYVVNTPDNRLEIFDVTPSAVTHLGAIAVGMEPVSVAVRPNGEVWVVNHISDSVSVVDPVTGTVVRTLLVGDEPRDIVFAGAAADRAFITTAHRGQHRSDPSINAVPGAGDPEFSVEGIGRADVWVFDASAPGDTLGGTPIQILSLFGDTPRALATSPDGATVYVAVFHSGNQTTMIHEAFVCDGFDPLTACNPIAAAPALTSPGGNPGPATNHEGLQAPEVGLIVRFDPVSGQWQDELGRDWSFWVRFSLPDQDVFAIDATTLAQTAAHSGVGTILFNMVTNPQTGKIYVSNTEARNEVRFEGPGMSGGSTVQGHLHEARITVIDGANVLPRHLNKHIDYGVLAGEPGFDPSAKSHSLATPVEMAVSNDGSTLYVAAFGSSRIGVIPTAALEADTFDPTILSAGYIDVSGGGPAGLVLDEANGRLFVATRFDNGLSVIDLVNGAEADHLTFFNPEPREVVIGRRFLYDADFTSANGEASCSSCHVFGDLDSLGWDLGNPDGDVTKSPLSILGGAGAGGLPTPINGTGNLDDFHPMKGPMTTQTLRGMSTHGALHWRGDRSNGALGIDALDADLSFRNFIVAFSGLVGRASDISEIEMQQFSTFALSLRQPPNPVRGLDNQLSISEQAGRDFYMNTPVDGVVTCEQCHRLDAADGLFGSGRFATFEGNTQIFKVPHLRNMYQKVGMFGFFANFGGNTGHTGDQIRGFGFSHTGAVDSLFRFVSAPAFSFPDEQSRRDMEVFLLAFDSDLAPVVGQQVTLTAANQLNVATRIDLLIARATADFASLVLGGLVKECDLIAHVSEAGMPRGYLYDPAAALFLPDDLGPGISDTALRQKATLDGDPVTYTCAPPGSGQRMGRDRDEDTLLDAVETGTGVFVSPSDTGSNPAAADTDGDLWRDGVEVAAGSDPNDPLSTPAPPVPLLSPLGVAILSGVMGRIAQRRLRPRTHRSAAA